MNAGHCLYPGVAHGLRSKFVGGMQDPVYPTFLYSTNHGSGHGDAGNSFLDLLYGPPSLLHHDTDFQELSDRKLCTLSGNCTAASGNFVVDSRESGSFQRSSGGPITENLNNHNLQSWTDSRAMVGLSSCSHSVFHDIHSTNTAAQPTFADDEKAREPSSSRGQCCGTSPASSPKVFCLDIQTTPNMALEQCPSRQAIPFMSGCPRVFCMGKCECYRHIFSYWLRDILSTYIDDSHFYCQFKRWLSSSQQYRASWYCLLMPLSPHVCP